MFSVVPQAGPSLFRSQGTPSPNSRASSPIPVRSDSDDEDFWAYLNPGRRNRLSDIQLNEPAAARSTSPSPALSESGSESEGSDLYWADDGDRNDAWWEEAYALADQGDDERVYAVSVGRETGTMARWYVLHQITPSLLVTHHYILY